MSLPYQTLTALGQDGIVCAARGSVVFTFGANGSLLSSWEHPATRRAPNPAVEAPEHGAADTESATPPPKRRKVDSDSADQASVKEATEEKCQPVEGEAAKTNGKKQAKKGGRSKPSDFSGQEKPYVNLLKATPSGSHLIAVTGMDKNVWVFEHDGKGQLKQLSQRMMPKRPSDITLTSDDASILVADKFGDVYAIPLLASAEDLEPGSAAADAGKPRAPKPPTGKGASALTVHSQRNLKALEDQKRQRENPPPERKEGPAFAHELLLGHVSMLTAVAVAAGEGGRHYVLSADRDEHVRVSRGMPQAHVIESFCLGHSAFINALCLPRPELLVSAGGDDDLYVWGWLSGTLRAKVNLLSHVQAVVPDATKVAVSRLVSHDGSVLAIVERVPAVFVFRPTETSLEYSQTLPLTGNPLDLAIVPASSSSPLRLVVGVDVVDKVADAELVVFEQKEGSNWVQADSPYQKTDVQGLEASRLELDKVLYAVENLRKTDFPYDDEAGETSAAPESEAATTPA